MYIYLYGILVIIIGILYPAYVIMTGESTRKMLIRSPHKRIMVYKHSGYLQIVLSIMIFIVMWLNGDRVELIGLAFIHHPVYTVISVVFCFIVLGLLNKITIDPSKYDELVAQFKDVMYILPATWREYKWSIGLCFVVGILEEIIMRGFLFWQLNQHMPLILAVITTNLIFAFAHFSTKVKNMVIAFLLGLFLSVVYLSSGSLLPAMIIHVLVDMYSATLARKVNMFQKD